jgi:succinate dehydrogenase / fumarate reductase iron-sulfur subunit
MPLSMTKRIEFSIYRYDPEIDAKPYMKEYVLEIDANKDMMLLQALVALKDQDESLSFRRSCGEGVCGSDGMNINGANGLACVTPLSTLKQPITLRPLPGLPVIRDLVVDMTPFMAQYEKVKPYVQNKENPPPKERLQTPEERAKLDGLYECILCGCCTSACPSYWWNPELFIGPAGLLAAARFINDSRDTQTEDRLDALQDPFSLFRCRGIMNCVSVCPKGLNPTAAIGEIREELVQRSV